jgi:hypothetical protein
VILPTAEFEHIHFRKHSKSHTQTYFDHSG